ncbi:MAG: GNAT family N-acetyltransferase [Campylobacteraceae bacterium]|jgi:ribosomal protein S18 acetylase RimI-like enzyme|nr:GNAT family N-acetyltransferase [Campylobacteraceae bacterium]
MAKSINIINCDYKNPKHTNAVKLLLNAYITDEMGGGKPLSEEIQKFLIKRLSTHKTAIVLLAQIDAEFAGLLIAFENIATFKAKPMINIHDIIVLKKYRGSGVGRMLMNAVADEAKKRGCVRITLEVREDNVIAQNLYKSMDFKETEPKMFYWRKEL